MNPKVERTLPILLSIAATGGVIATSYLIAVTAPKANEKIKEARQTGSKKEVVKEFVKQYKWPLVLGSATIASIVSGTIISKKVEASLSATALMLDGAYRKYKHKVKDLLGDKANDVIKSIADGDYKKNKDKIKNWANEDPRQMYYEEHIGFFKANPNDLVKAMALTNEKIITRFTGTEHTQTDHWASLQTLLEDCNAELLSKDIDKVSYDYGWSFEYLNDVYHDDMFVHIKENPRTDENGQVDYIEISFDKEPIFGIFDTYKQWEKLDMNRAIRQNESNFNSYEDTEILYNDTNEVITNEKK